MSQELPSERILRIFSRGIPNPMDWRPIDRLILLAFLVLVAPVGFGAALWTISVAAPQYLNEPLVPFLFTGYAAHSGLLLAFIFEAFRRRQFTDQWPVFENFIIGGYLIVVMLSAYLTGTHYGEGLLLLFLGVNITGALADVNKIRKCYWFVIPILMVMGVTDFIHAIPYALLLEQSPVTPSGRPVVGWLILKSIFVAVLLLLIYLCILAMKRWVERESLYLEMSTIDGLTRLSNRNSVINRGQEEIERSLGLPKPLNASLACIMIDLDHFKSINDTWGHHAGDAVLVEASRIMMENARKNDEVGRYGGEEFVVLLPGTNLKKATQIAERLRVRISEAQVIVDETEIRITASFGVACFPSNGIDNVDDLLKKADKALYDAKEGGRNKVVTSV